MRISIARRRDSMEIVAADHERRMRLRPRIVAVTTEEWVPSWVTGPKVLAIAIL